MLYNIILLYCIIYIKRGRKIAIKLDADLVLLGFDNKIELVSVELDKNDQF